LFKVSITPALNYLKVIQHFLFISQKIQISLTLSYILKFKIYWKHTKNYLILVLHSRHRPLNNHGFGMRQGFTIHLAIKFAYIPLV